MAFWSRLLGLENLTVPQADSPGDPVGLEYVGGTETRQGLPFVLPSPWNGWPSDWSTQWNTVQAGLNTLIDTAWACIDLNSNVLASMPVYRTQSGQIIEPKTWMIQPDESIYTGWQEFAKQVFWDFQLGEVFIMSMAEGSDNYPAKMRVVPPWCVNVDMVGGTRVYSLAGDDVTGRILHIRYQSTTADARGHGPLEVGNARMVTAGVLQQYAKQLAQTGGVPTYWIGVKEWLSSDEAESLLNQWIESRKRHMGEPALLSRDATMNQTSTMNAKDMALLELAQFTESRIAVLLGVPPFLVGLPGPGGLTYANETQLFDFHDRSSLRPKADAVMSALSNWALPRGQTVELNRDEYSRPDFASRADAWVKLMQAGVIGGEFVRKAERFNGDAAPGALTGRQAQGPQSNPNEGNGDAVQGGQGQQVSGE